MTDDSYCTCRHKLEDHCLYAPHECYRGRGQWGGILWVCGCQRFEPLPVEAE